MYFPYLRGKQFELIALREFECSDASKIAPIIEPIKKSSTLGSASERLMKHNINFTLIINPRVGDFSENLFPIDFLETSIKENPNFRIGIIVDKKLEEQLDSFLADLQKAELKDNYYALIHFSEVSSKTREKLKKELDVHYNVIYEYETSRRYHRSFEGETIVYLEDPFKKLDRNAEYLQHPFSDFSDEYRYYKEDGFIGFGDFLTVGDHYSEIGFLPRAVAIHLSYICNDKICIRHFTSDSNQDSSDVAGKFMEALEKAFDWIGKSDIMETTGVKALRDLHNNKHFPGLGTLKKISMVHHVELLINNMLV